ncbi:MAG: NAD(P)/FAD-dependent oxidoreductase [Archaeoglobaceae archaeon]
MIQIYGAGVAGTFLYNLLIKNSFKTSIFDVRKTPDCTCGWGIAYREAKELYSEIDLNFEDYVLSKPDRVVVNGISFKNKGIATFDKLQLLSDLWEDIEFQKSKCDLTVDATGVKRAFLPKIERDRQVPSLQFLEKHEREEEILIHFERHGYAWAFPLGGEWHIGAGSILEKEIPGMINRLRKKYGIPEKEALCSCRGKIRMLPPSKCRPFICNGVVGVGEAIGCVSGSGEGNVPALKSAKILFECIENLEIYEERILKELEWIEREQKFLDSILKGFPAFHLLPKIVSFERKRLVEHSILDFLRVFI